MIIAIDFDGTCVTHEYPYIGRDIGAVKVLQDIINNGHDLILFTMRSNITEIKGNGKEIIHAKAGNYLDEAVKWFEKYKIPLYGVNNNPDQKEWTSSPKVYAHLYIDDAALGIPLIYNKHKRPFVDWCKVEEYLKELKVI